MKNIQRIAIIGNAGSGKSVLAQQLHKIFHLPVYHLDKYFWKPHWEHPDINEYKIVHDALCDREAWIIDGMNLRVAEHRINRAQMVIFLDLPRYLCFWRIFKRLFKYYGQVAPSSAEQCPERFNWAFIKFLKWVWEFKKRYPNKIRELLNAAAATKEVYIFKSQSEIDAFVKQLKQRVL